MERYKRGEEIDCKIYEFVLCKAFRKRKIIVAQCIYKTPGSGYQRSGVWSILCTPLVKQQQQRVVYRLRKPNTPTATYSLLPQ
jgi:hypothetical protein